MLKKPYPRSDDFRRSLVAGLLVAVFVALFLLIFQPFGMSSIPAPSKYWQIGCYGLVTLAGLAVGEWIPRLIWKNYFSESRWTVGKQILWMMIVILLIALGNMYYTYLLGYTQLSLQNTMFFTGFTIAVGFFPITASILLNYSRLARTNSSVAQVINSDLAEADKRESAEAAGDEIHKWTFKGENANEEFSTDEKQLLYIESADNYSMFHWLENGTVRKKLLRGSLKSMEDQVSAAELFRCHRTFIVNLKKVVSVSGNSQGYRLKIAGTDAEVPVARNSGKMLHEKLKSLKR
ncbi:MAG: response regulator receiver protein [Bacteroidetes bacterium]|nr:MAG: response regulator receiver protein [Bacteroidota bacterium]